MAERQRQFPPAVVGCAVETKVWAKTLFATHYHELTTLADHLDRVENVHVAADESDCEVTFLRTVRDGPTDRSYGVHVADLAGVPGPVVDRSRDVLDRLREEKAIEARGGSGSGPVQAVFDLSSGGFRGDGRRNAPQNERTGSGATRKQATADGGQSSESDDATDQFDEHAADVLKAISDLNVDETPPVELMAKVQEWQTELDGE